MRLQNFYLSPAVLLAFLLYPAGFSYGWSLFGPKNYDDCVLKEMKGVSSDLAAREVRRACRKKFPRKSMQLTHTNIQKLAGLWAVSSPEQGSEREWRCPSSNEDLDTRCACIQYVHIFNFGDALVDSLRIQVDAVDLDNVFDESWGLNKWLVPVSGNQPLASTCSSTLMGPGCRITTAVGTSETFRSACEKQNPAPGSYRFKWNIVGGTALGD